MGLLDEVKGSKEVGLTGARCGAANVDAADRAIGAEDHGAARDGYRVGVMTDLDAWYVGNRVVQQKPPQPDREGSLYLYVQPGPALMDAGQWVYVGLGTETLTAARGRLRDSFYPERESRVQVNAAVRDDDGGRYSSKRGSFDCF